MGTIHLPLAERQAALNFMLSRVDAGSGSGKLNIYSGTAPSPNAVATGTLLGTFSFSDPAFGNTDGNGTATAGAIADVTWIASGTAGYYRALDSNDVVRWQGDVGVTGSGAELELNNTSVSSGGTGSITSFIITMPDGVS
ncbi:MAG: hypothetical protein AAGF15_02175 [Pseudomonadota bacterium]